MSRIMPVNIGGSASSMRFTASSIGISSPSARIPVSSMRCPTIRLSPVSR